MMTQQYYKSNVKPIFCPGCGDYGVNAALTKAFVDLQLERENVVIVSGIGCSSSMPHTFATYGFHSLHGRALAVAEGIKLANSKLTVVATGGDGDGYGIGLNHFIHAARRNVDITYVVMDNEIYGLTTGQASPTSGMGHKTKSTPFGVIEKPINPIAMAITAGATFVARGFSGDPIFLADLIAKGIKHKGFSLIDVESPCVSFNKVNTFEWARRVVYKLDESHDKSNMAVALDKAFEFDRTPEKFATGIFYETERPTYEDLAESLKKGTLAGSRVTDEEAELFLNEYAV
ncbi:MAG: 2-oxoacid:ferredoxin oxidoreductase subunit beta [Candidatus Micrarchaeaceae archaeon]